MTELRFETRTPAETWEDGLIVGSGRVGALVHGSPDRLVVSFTHERFFVPANARPAAPDLGHVLPELRDRLRAGDSTGASDAMENATKAAGYDSLVWTDPLGMCATLFLTTPGGVTSFSRTIDLARGTVAVSWLDELGGSHRVHLVAPRGFDTVWVAIESDHPSRIQARLALDAVDDAPAASFAPDYSGAVSAKVHGGRQGRVDVVDREGVPLASVRATAVVSWAEVPGGSELAASISGSPQAAQLLRFDISVAGNPEMPAPDAEWESIFETQTIRHEMLVRASALDLNGADLNGAGDGNVEEVWASARSGDRAARRRAVEIAYASGRSHIIAATGELPPTLQGVWQGTWKPAWSADYTLNGNVQNGAMAGLIPTGTPELARSLLELILPFLDDYRENAALIFGAEGMLLPSRMSTHGRADHFNTQFPHLFWVGCGGWILRIAADIVSTTGDRTLVDDRLWELVEGVLRFGETATELRESTRHFSPSYSPENTPDGRTSPLAQDSTIDIAIFRDAARSAEMLGHARGDDTLNERWAALSTSLPDYRIADDGTLAEWSSGPWRENVAHRHVSQLYPLWYETDAAFEGEDGHALRAAAAATIRNKIAWRAADPAPPPGRMEMAFGLVQLGVAAAALGDSASALRCAEWLAIDHWRPSLTTTHDAGRIFNLDASGGLPAVVAAMLFSSTVDTLTVLPAVPVEWVEGAVTGLRARGGVVVDRLEWDADGCAIELRRLPEAHWLNPEGRLELRAGRGFRIEGHGRHHVTLRAGESTALRLRWMQ